MDEGNTRCERGRPSGSPDVDSGLPPGATGRSAALHVPGERAHGTRDGPTVNRRQTATTDRSRCPSVFDAGLPTINYEYAQHPDEAHAIISKARQQAPVALGPHGPELLTCELV